MAKQLGTNFNLEFWYSKLLKNLAKETSHLLIWYVSKYNRSFNQCPLYLIINILVFILAQHGIAVYYFTENTSTLLLENEESIKLIVTQNNLKGTILIKQSVGEGDVYVIMFPRATSPDTEAGSKYLMQHTPITTIISQGLHVNSMNVRK